MGSIQPRYSVQGNNVWSHQLFVSGIYSNLQKAVTFEKLTKWIANARATFEVSQLMHKPEKIWGWVGIPNKISNHPNNWVLTTINHYQPLLTTINDYWPLLTNYPSWFCEHSNLWIRDMFLEASGQCDSVLVLILTAAVIAWPPKTLRMWHPTVAKKKNVWLHPDNQ